MIQMERLATQTLLGIRFWDRAGMRAVVDGLIATAQILTDDRARRLGRVRYGHKTIGDTIAFFDLHPGERALEDPQKQLWETVPAARLVAIELSDAEGRYLPMTFVVQIPYRGAFRGRSPDSWQTTPLMRPVPTLGEEEGVMLWPSPTYGIPSGQTALRGNIVVGAGEHPAPARYALVEVSQPSGTYQYFGLCDKQGTFRLPLPYPPVPDPPNSIYPALDKQEFDLTLSVYYSSAQQRTVHGQAVDYEQGELPDMETILGQPQVTIGAYWDAAPALQTAATLLVKLRYGRPLIVRTRVGGPAALETESFLRIGV